MLPPLNLADAKRDFFSPRKRNHVRRSTVGVATPNGVGFSPQTPRKGSTDAISETIRADGDATCSGSALVTSLSLIPREFFVVERNSVLPAGQYPPSIYQSSFSAGEGGLWETIVFPALAPQTRQQVLYLRQTLEKLREALLRASAAEEASLSSPTAASESPRRQDRVQRGVVEYTKQEARIYSVCFHELTRQVKFICKEQSELLCEVRERYDAIVSRLSGRILQLDDERSHWEDRINKLGIQVDDLSHANAALKRANARQAALIADLELHPSTRSGNDSDQSEEEDDDEAQEAEWQRQRRELASVDAVTSTKKRRDSVAEENLAAARVQTAFHKFQMRKAQHALALRVEKNVAALDIQRSYRGFRGRQRTLHHRAVMQTIMKRREQIAAVELLQENVRAYLHKRRRSVTTRRNTIANPSVESVSSVEIGEPIAAAAPVEPTTDPSLLPGIPESVSESATQLVRVEEATPSRNLLRRILATSDELMTAVKELQSHSQRGSIVSFEFHRPGSAIARAEAQTSDSEINTVDADERQDDSSPAWLASDEEETKLLWRTLQQTRSLVLSLEEVIGPGCNSIASTPGAQIAVAVPPLVAQGAEFDSHGVVDVVSVGVSTSTSSLDNLDAAPSKGDGRAVTPAQDTEDEVHSMAATALPELDSTTRSDDGYEHDRIESRFHLDDSLWRSATYYAAPDHGDESQHQLLVLMSSREQRKRLVQLKQFISDVYDTIVGRMRELPPSQLAGAVKSAASLALSCDEWQQQRQSVLLRAAGDPAAIGVLAAVIPSDLQEMSREHFRCQLGLNNLVETAMQDLYAAAECFAPVDPDVGVFFGFLTHERLYDELEFRCVCRYLCAQGGSLGAPCSTKQPVFHPSTMREVLPVTSALQLARLLFRVDEQESLTASDARYVEVENAVYRQYQPVSGFQQCEEIMSRYFPAAADILASPPTNPSSPVAAAPPVASPRTPLSALTRATNCSQFHAKQYNATASRSPLVRRQHQQQAASQRLLPLPQSGDADMDGGKWVYFDDVVALLLKYRAEMHSFHLFLHWAIELFALSADAGAGTGAAASAPFMSERAFAQALTPISLGPRDRELRNLFHNALRQRHLRLYMPQRTFTSVVLLLLENRMVSVSKYAPMDKPRRARTDDLRALLGDNAPVDSAASQGEDNVRAWRVLARQWRAREAAFEDAVEALFHVGGDGGLRHALRLMQLRNELLDLLATRPASALLRGFEVYEELVDGVEPRVEVHEDTVGAVSVTGGEDVEEVDQEDGDEEQEDWEDEEESGRDESPWSTDPQPA